MLLLKHLFPKDQHRQLMRDSVFLHESGSGFFLDPEPDAVFKFLWIQISTRIPEKKKGAERALKFVLEINLRILTMAIKKWKATISY